MIKWRCQNLNTAFGQVTTAAKTSCDFLLLHSRRIGAAFSVDSPLHHKWYHAAKAVCMSGVLVASIATLNPEGVIGAGFATADEISDLEKAGEQVLSHMAAPHNHIT